MGRVTSRTRRRIGTVIVAPAAALALRGLIRSTGIDLDVSTGNGTIGPADVLTAALIGALAGWLVVRRLESHSRHPRRRWAFTGSTALSMSMLGPAWLADGSSALALMTLHLVTGAVVITGFAATLPLRCSSSERH
jgi:hypothetical protein